jgi:hypothetical protein
VPYSSTVHRLLISAPGDVPETDFGVVIAAINRWNAIYGRQFAAVVVPTHWRLHAAPEHGNRPQASLNSQLVDTADILVALFWHRFGSSTGEAESGTIEEIDEAERNGAHVVILRCARDLPQIADPDQMKKLRAFYEEARPTSLMLEYGNDADLARHIDTVLSRAVTRDDVRAEAAVERSRQPAEVWPRVESSEQVSTDSKGRMKTRRRWQLVLANTGAEPARNVRYRLEAENDGDNLPIEPDDQRELEVLPPNGEAPYVLMLHMGVAHQVRCIVTWEDATGEHEHRATLRLL